MSFESNVELFRTAKKVERGESFERVGVYCGAGDIQLTEDAVVTVDHHDDQEFLVIRVPWSSVEGFELEDLSFRNTDEFAESP